MQKTGIEYLTHTWNPIAMRCSKCSPGCDGCWHLRTADRLCKNPALPENERAALAGTGPFILRERELSAPLRTKKPAVIGVQFMGDLFHEKVPSLFPHHVNVRMAQCEQHTFLMLTKRPRILLERKIPPFDHVWHGLTICNQPEADEKIPIFLQVPGRKFLSIEPMLGPIDLAECFTEPASLALRYLSAFYNTPDGKFDPEGKGHQYNRRVKNPVPIVAVILGGETGPGARPMHPDWVRLVRDQCATAGVPFFFKGWGEWLHESQLFGSGIRLDWFNDHVAAGGFARAGSKHMTRRLDGRMHDELPWRTTA